MYGGFCTNCDEEIFIEEQYLMWEGSVPQGIADTAEEQRQRKRELEGVNGKA
jgi:hypothetical protein